MVSDPRYHGMASRLGHILAIRIHTSSSIHTNIHTCMRVYTPLHAHIHTFGAWLAWKSSLRCGVFPPPCDPGDPPPPTTGAQILALRINTSVHKCTYIQYTQTDTIPEKPCSLSSPAYTRPDTQTDTNNLAIHAHAYIHPFTHTRFHMCLHPCTRSLDIKDVYCIPKPLMAPVRSKSCEAWLA